MLSLESSQYQIIHLLILWRMLPVCDQHSPLPGQGHLGKSHLESFYQGNKAEKLEYMVSNTRQDLGADAGCLLRQDAMRF